MGAIQNFRSDNPQCTVHIDISEDLARLEYGEAHIALRAGEKPDHPDYVVTHFGDITFNLYANDCYLKKHGPAGVHDGFAGHSFVLPDFPLERLPFGAWIEEHIDPAAVALSSRDIGVIEKAVHSGIGLGFLSDAEAQKRDNLRVILPATPDWTVTGWLITHVDLHRTEKVQAMLSCMMLSCMMLSCIKAIRSNNDG